MIALMLGLQLVPAQDVRDFTLNSFLIATKINFISPFIFINHLIFTPQIVKKAMTYMEHDRWMEYRSKHLVFALEQFASEVKQQQMRPDYMYLEDNAAIEEENESEGGEEEMEWKEGGEKDEDKECTDDDEEDDDDEAIQEIHDREQEELDAARDLPTAGEREEAENNIFGYDVVIPNVATPQFDELFPPVASNSGTHCLSREILAKTWNATGIRFHRSDLTVYGEDEDAFYGKLNDSLNAYIATMLLEPRSLDAAFANVDD